MVQLILFFAFSGAAIIFAILMISMRNMILSALCLMMTFCFIAGLYVLLNAQFIAALEVLIYSGAIMVLFLFVIMLIQLKQKTAAKKELIWQKIIGILLALLLFGFFLFLFIPSVNLGKSGEFNPEKVNFMGNTEAFSQQLFIKYLYPFEIISVLLLAAIIGAVILTKKKV